MKIGRYVGLLLLLSACGSNGITTPHDEDRQATIAAFQQARARWGAAGPANYVYRFQRICFCAPPTTTPAVLEVRGRRVASATLVDGTVVEPAAYPTIDELFAAIEAAIAARANVIRVSYDAALGHPTSIYIDEEALLADEEQSYEAAGLVPIS